MATLGTRASDRDALAFVGRERELEQLEGLLVDDPPANLVFIHGEGGIGKSTLLRELARRAVLRGWTIHTIEGRDLPPGPDAIEDAIADARAEPKPLILFDTYELASGLGGYLRRAVLPSLPERAVIVIAGRRPPEAAWTASEWSRMMLTLPLSGLDSPDALEVLRRNGVESMDEAREIEAWAHGSPLALTLAAQATITEPDIAGADREELLAGLVGRLVDSETDNSHLRTLWTAAIARVTTPELLAATMPDRSSEAEYEWLRARSFIAPLGDGLAPHELVRRALRGLLVETEPMRERELRQLICDHLYERAQAGDPLTAIDLAHLAENPMIRWGFSWEMNARLRIDDAHGRDREAIANTCRAMQWGSLLPGTMTCLDLNPELITVVRDETEQLLGYTIAVAGDTAPAWALDDPLLGPRIEHARSHDGGAQAVIWREVFSTHPDPGAGVTSMLGMSGVLKAGRGNPRYAYLPIDPAVAGATAFSQALGAVEIPELAIDIVDGPRLECHLVDYGPGGSLAAQRALIHRELGLGDLDQERTAPEIDMPAEVRRCLRSLQLPHELASSPLAIGDSVDERAASVRALLSEAAEHGFGADPSDRLTHDVLTLGYLDPSMSHEAAADRLNLSRSAYFRRLGRANERVANYLTATRSGDAEN
jgi:hypothetical protein